MIVLLGPTASGKTKLAAQLAYDLGSEIISGDSRQVYRGMDLGTGKDLEEFTVEGKKIPYHLIDIIDPTEDFSVYDYQRLFYKCFQEIASRGIIPILVGGSGLYIDCVLRGYQMPKAPINGNLRMELEKLDLVELRNRLLSVKTALHNTTDLLDRERIIRAIEIALAPENEELSRPYLNPFVVGVRWKRDVLRQRITERLKKRLEAGMVEEVENLHKKGLSFERLKYFGLEYRFIALYLEGQLTYKEMFEQLKTKIHQFAKRQETWFRRMERLGVKIHWLDEPRYEELRALVFKALYGNTSYC